jgi:hypothetical protein
LSYRRQVFVPEITLLYSGVPHPFGAQTASHQKEFTLKGQPVFFCARVLEKKFSDVGQEVNFYPVADPHKTEVFR